MGLQTFWIKAAYAKYSLPSSGDAFGTGEIVQQLGLTSQPTIINNNNIQIFRIRVVQVKSGFSN